MKNLLLLIIFIFSFQISFSQWNSVSVGTSENLYSIDYYSQNDVWIGSSHRFIKTSNNGTNWTMTYPMYDIFNAQIFGSLLDISLTGTNSALCTGLFYTGNDELIYKTTNGGANWDYVHDNNTVGLPRFLKAIDKIGSLCVAVGNNGRIGLSANSGNTWAFVSSGTTELINDVKYFSTDTLIATGYNVILKSVNGGNSWAISTTTDYHHSVSGFNNIVYIGNESSQSMLRSVDHGSTFNTIALPFSSNGVLYATSPDTLLAAGQDGLYISTSGGQYWEKFILSGYKEVNMFDFIDPNNGFAVGDSGYAIRTTNLANTPAIPVVSFAIQGGGTTFCQGVTLILNNTTAPIPGYSYEWKIDSTSFSTQFNATYVLNAPGAHTISLTVTNANGYDVFEQQINVTGHNLLPFTLVNVSDTLCSGNKAGFSVPNSQTGSTYRLRNGFTNMGASQNGTGGTLYFASANGLTSPTEFNMIATNTNACFTDSIIQYDSVYIATSGLKPACIPTGSNVIGITNVTFNAINNASSPSTGNYNDFSCLLQTDLIIGSTYPITITATNQGNFRVWIDLDSSGTFNSSNEIQFTGTSFSNTINGNIVIPVSHQLFNVPLRLRVGFDGSASSLSFPCGSGFNGEFEDYAVTILTAPSLPVASFGTSANTVCNTTITFTNTTFNATSYLWDFGDGNSATSLNTNHVYMASGTYNVSLIAYNSIGSDTTVQSITVQNPLVPIAPVCNPIENILSCDNKEIVSFQLNGTYSNSSSNAFYEDFTCTVQAHLTRDSTYAMAYAVRDQVSNTCSGTSCVWIDYDNDGAFNDSTERLISGTMLGCPATWVYFTVPNTSVVNTPLRIRIMAAESGFANSCSQICGQYEEYTAFIDPYPFMNVSFTANNTAACINSPVIFANTTVNAVSYAWDFGDGGTSTLMNPSHSYSASGIYSVKLVACNGNGNCDSLTQTNYITVAQNISQIVALGATTFCRGDSVLLSALPSFSNYQWYRFGTAIPGATAMTYTAKTRGNYYCVSLSPSLCTDTSNTILVKVPCIPIGPNHEKLDSGGDATTVVMQVFPNPGSGLFTVSSPPGQLQVFNSLGSVIYEMDMSDAENMFDISGFPDGIYVVTLRTSATFDKQRIVLLR